MKILAELSKQKFIKMLIVVFMLSVQTVWSTTYWSTGDGNFSDPTFWSTSQGGGGSYTASAADQSAHDFIIDGGDIVTVTQNTSVLSLTILSGGEFDCDATGGDFTLTLVGDLDINSGGTWTNDGDCAMGGAVAQDIDFSGSGQFGDLTINNSGSGTDDNVTLSTNIIVSGLFTISAGEFLPQTTTVRLAGNFSKTGGALTPGQSTFWFSEVTAYTVTTNSDISFYNITHNPSGLTPGRTLTFSSSFVYQIQNRFTRGGESASVTQGAGADLTYDTGVLTYLSTNNMTVGDEWPTDADYPADVELSTSSTITHSSGTRSVDNLVVDGGGTFSISGGTITINTELDIANGTFSSAAAGFAYGSGATLKYSNSSTAQTVGNEWTASDVPANLIVVNSSGGSPALNLGSGTPSRSLSGSLTLSDGSVDFSVSGQNLTVGGNVIGGSGSFGTVTDDAKLTVTGTNSVITSSGGATTLHDVTFNGTVTGGGLSQVTVEGILELVASSNVTLTNAITASTITLNGSLNLGGYSIGGTPSITLGGGGFLYTNGSSISTYTINSNAGTVVYDGTSSEIIPGKTFNNLVIDNSSGVDVSTNSPVVNNTLTLTNGILSTIGGLITTASITTAGSFGPTLHVSGPLALSGGGDQTFPIGKDGIYRPVNVTNTTGTTRFELFNNNPEGTPGVPPAVISSVRYWVGSGTISSTTSTVELAYGGGDGVTDTGDLVVASSTSSAGTYADNGQSGLNSTFATSVESAANLGFSSLRYFTLGSTAGDNSLPVTLSSFTAEPKFGGVSLSWVTQSELQNDGFNIYRRDKKVNTDWQLLTLSMIPGQGNTSEKTIYTYEDRKAQAGVTYEYMLESVSYTGVRVQEKVVEVLVPMPTEYATLGNYPNPFNPTTQIGFRLPETSDVSILIYGIQGNLVRELALNQSFDAGDHFVAWDATDNNGLSVASGMYVYLFRAGKYNKTEKMLLLK